jgi:hypothetical protein
VKRPYDERSGRGRSPRGRRLRERAYIDALVERYSIEPNADLKAMAVRYKDAMRELARRYLEDLDAATLYAESLMDLHPWMLWSADGKPTEGTEDIVATLEAVLRRDPMHIGANHYYIHAVEASKTPGRALASAGRLETLVPDAGHSSTCRRTSTCAPATTRRRREQREAADVDRQYIKARGANGLYPMMITTTTSTSSHRRP